MEVAYDTAGRLNEFVEEWFGLLELCRNGITDQRDFKQRHDAYAKRWARLPYDEQGEVNHMICQRLLE